MGAAYGEGEGGAGGSGSDPCEGISFITIPPDKSYGLVHNGNTIQAFVKIERVAVWHCKLQSGLKGLI
jgi:hypothetical protein